MLRTMSIVLFMLFLRDVLGKTEEAITGSFVFIGVLLASVRVSKASDLELLTDVSCFVGAGY